MANDFQHIINRLQQGRVWDFPGGVHPPEHKALSNLQHIARLPLPKKLYVPLKQHIGVEGQLAVTKGEYVKKGQPLTTSSHPFAVPVHAPTSGTISEISQHVSAHPSAMPEATVTLLPDGEESWYGLTPLINYQQVPKTQVIEQICQAGISGMGGAGFPAHIKVSPKKDVEFLIINGIECEPYITSDDRLMREHAQRILQGVEILNHLLSPRQVVVAIEDNKPEAIDAMQAGCDERGYILVSVPTKYPAGGEKQLIQLLTQREVPQHGLPIDVGVIMQNVGTCFAVAEAVLQGKPLIERVVTITGGAMNAPGNVWALLGTPVSHLLSQGEYQAQRQSKQQLIMGGPMMGFTLPSPQVPITKISNCLLVPASKELANDQQESPCIRCGACEQACPAGLLPQQLFWHAKGKEYDKTEQHNLFDCIECGACAFVCPSQIPLVHYYRVAKADIRAERAEKIKAEKAKERFEARNARLQKQQQEREEKHRKAAEARRQAMDNQAGAKDKIAAALARAKAKKAQQGTEPAAPETSNAADINTSPDKKQTKSVAAAAIARAKAKRAASAAAQNTQQTTAEVNKEQSGTTGSPTPDSQSTDNPAQDKKAKIAAAVARAKAKKHAAAQAQSNTESEQANKATAPASGTESAVAPATEKKAKIAAAVARAKAKKLAAQQQEDNK